MNMKISKLERRENRFNTIWIVAASMVAMACGGAPVATSTPDEEVITRAESPEPPPADDAAPAEAEPAAADDQPGDNAESPADAAAPVSTDVEKAEAPAAEPSAPEAVETKDSELTAPAVSSDKPVAEQIKETRAELAKAKKALTRATKSAKTAEKKLRTAEANNNKAAEKSQKDSSILANAEEKQKMIQDQLKEAERILGLAEGALKEMKEKEPKTFKEKKDVADSISSQSTFVNQKKALVRKKTEALKKQDKTVTIAKAKAEKTGKTADERKAEYEKAVKADTEAKEALAALEKQIETLTRTLSDLESRKAEEKAKPTPASK